MSAKSGQGRPVRRRAGGAVGLVLLSAAAAGCPYVPPETRFAHVQRTEPTTNSDYWIYLPTDYSEARRWPLVITLHGTNPWDGRTRQILEWKDTAERHGLIVVAPQLRSTQGPLPVVPTAGYADAGRLASDDEAIVAILGQVRRDYAVDGNCVLLTGFSSGGYPLLYTGLRHPELFGMLIARDCNVAMGTLRQTPLTDAARKLPILIFWGKDDVTIREQSWAAFRYLRENRCFQVQRETLAGGHIRRPELAYQAWAKRLPAHYRR